VRLLRWRRKQRAEPIGEAEAYARSYGEHSPDVKLVRLPPRRPRDRKVLESGETLRLAFLDRLERRRGGGTEQARDDDQPTT
jgi:hypothetical protein